mmetsp:Transcript_53125/g.114872  ORF Transcript_53125/g.114872 Transcript_53125/m.114872 type:complete len:209 (+) Transcript_53125:972-1598(+)
MMVKSQSRELLSPDLVGGFPVATSVIMDLAIRVLTAGGSAVQSSSSRSSAYTSRETKYWCLYLSTFVVPSLAAWTTSCVASGCSQNFTQMRIRRSSRVLMICAQRVMNLSVETRPLTLEHRSPPPRALTPKRNSRSVGWLVLKSDSLYSMSRTSLLPSVSDIWHRTPNVSLCHREAKTVRGTMRSQWLSLSLAALPAPPCTRSSACLS